MSSHQVESGTVPGVQDLNRESDAQPVLREFGHLAMKDGVRLAYVVWRARADGRYPTVLNYSAYGQGATAFAEAKRFLEAGYAYVGANVRGTGASEGTFSYYDPIEGADGVELIEWIAAQPWSTGHVGMVGGSYGGHTQVKIAALQPRPLKAIVPMCTEGSDYHDEAVSGGLLNASLMAHWTFNIQPSMARVGVECRRDGGDPLCDEIVARQQPNGAYHEVLQHPLYDDWWRVRALDRMADRVTVPTLLIHAWQDEWIRPNGALRIFKRLATPHKKLLLQNGAHALNRYDANLKEQLRWLDRWVKGERNGVDTEPRVKVLWEISEAGDASRAAPNWVTSYADWPIPSAQWTPFYLTSAGALTREPPAVSGEQGVRRYVFPLGTELVGSNEQFASPAHPLGELSYRTAPFGADAMLLGCPKLTFYFSADQVDTDFMFTLKDVDPGGNTLFLQRSVLRASMRAVDREASGDDEIVHSFDKPEPLTPGKIYEIAVSIGALGHVARAGHSIELSILSPNAVPTPVWGFVLSPQSSVNTIYHSDEYRSKIELPIVLGEAAQKPAPPLGTLKNQPFRSGTPTASAPTPPAPGQSRGAHEAANA